MARSVIWPIYEGSFETGYTIHEINHQLAAGRILLLEKIQIDFQTSLPQTVSWNYARLLSDSVLGLVHLLADFETIRTQSRPQGAGRSFTSPTYQQYQRMLHQHKILARTRRVRVAKAQCLDGVE